MPSSVSSLESTEGQNMARELQAAKARIAELEQQLRTQRQEDSNTSQATRLMTLVTEVRKQFWETYDADAPKAKPPSQKEIIWWLESTYGLSNAEAKAVEKVACPENRDRRKSPLNPQTRNQATMRV